MSPIDASRSSIAQWIARWRLLMLGCFVFVLAIWLASGMYVFTLAVPSGFHADLRDGILELYQLDADEFVFDAEANDFGESAAAWRPVHTTIPGYSSPDSHGVRIPLWHFLLLSFGAAAFGFGFVV